MKMTMLAAAAITVAADVSRPEDAKALWERVLGLMPEGAPERQQLQHEIDTLKKPAN